MKQTHNAGFTLIELLVVAAIMAILIAAIGACLGGGLRVWDAARRFGAAETDGMLALDLLGRELRSTFALGDIPFKGAEGEIAFAGLVRDAAGGTTLGTIRYLHSGPRRALLRETQALADESGRVGREGLAEGVTAVQFQYHYPRGMESNALPDRVQITLTVDAGDARPPVVLARIVDVPAGARP